MSPSDPAHSDTLTKMAESRAEIRRLLEPPPRPVEEDSLGSASDGNRGAGFPRSRTMRLLMSGRGVGTVGAMVGGLLMARPRLAFRLLRMVPTGAVSRMLLVKAISAIKSRRG